MLVFAAGLLVDLVAGFGVGLVSLDLQVILSLAFALIGLPFFFGMILPHIWFLLPLATVILVPIFPLLFGEWMASGLLLCFGGLGFLSGFLGASVDTKGIR